jgi:membrane dipeptidase
MNQLGMTIDTAHGSDRTAVDTIELSEKSTLMSVVGARAQWNTNRMMPDDVLRACGENGGVIGIEAAPHTTLTPNHPQHSIESIMEHVEHIAHLWLVAHGYSDEDIAKVMGKEVLRVLEETWAR